MGGLFPTEEPRLVFEQRDWRRSECATFFRSRDRFGAFSNMAGGYPLDIDNCDVTIGSTEALYQACRYPDYPDVQGAILQQPRAHDAKRVQVPHKHKTRADWDQVKVPIMRWCLELKAHRYQHQMHTLLLALHGRKIVEESTVDTFWGAIPQGTGSVLWGVNVLGQLWTPTLDRILVRQLKPQKPQIDNLRLLNRLL